MTNFTSNSDNSCDSEKPRPRRRASQTYFFKYQLAKNPLKAEEEDLQQALIDSLKKCGQPKTNSSKKQHVPDESSIDDRTGSAKISSKTKKHNQQENQKVKQSRKQNPRCPPNNKHNKTSDNMVPATPVTVATNSPPTYDEEYLENYRPSTEDFLALICSHVTATDHPRQQIITKSEPNSSTSPKKFSSMNGCIQNGNVDIDNISSIAGSLNIKIESNIANNIDTLATDTLNSSLTNDRRNPDAGQNASPDEMNHSSPSPSSANNQLGNPSSDRRRPSTRQSSRLAKIAHR